MEGLFIISKGKVHLSAHFLERSFQDKNFDESSFVVRRLLKELLGVQESILCHLYLGNAENFRKLCKKCSMNLIDRDSGGLQLIIS